MTQKAKNRFPDGPQFGWKEPPRLTRQPCFGPPVYGGKLLTLTLWLLTFVAALFVPATEVWQGAPRWYFSGAVLLGVLEPLGTWIIVKRYPETDWLAWLLLGIMAGIVVILALLRLVRF